MGLICTHSSPVLSTRNCTVRKMSSTATLFQSASNPWFIKVTSSGACGCKVHITHTASCALSFLHCLFIPLRSIYHGQMKCKRESMNSNAVTPQFLFVWVQLLRGPVAVTKFINVALQIYASTSLQCTRTEKCVVWGQLGHPFCDENFSWGTPAVCSAPRGRCLAVGFRSLAC